MSRKFNRFDLCVDMNGAVAAMSSWRLSPAGSVRAAAERRVSPAFTEPSPPTASGQELQSIVKPRGAPSREGSNALRAAKAALSGRADERPRVQWVDGGPLASDKQNEQAVQMQPQPLPQPQLGADAVDGLVRWWSSVDAPGGSSSPEDVAEFLKLVAASPALTAEDGHDATNSGTPQAAENESGPAPEGSAASEQDDEMLVALAAAVRPAAQPLQGFDDEASSPTDVGSALASMRHARARLASPLAAPESPGSSPWKPLRPQTAAERGATSRAAPQPEPEPEPAPKLLSAETKFAKQTLRLSAARAGQERAEAALAEGQAQLNAALAAQSTLLDRIAALQRENDALRAEVRTANAPKRRHGFAQRFPPACACALLGSSL